MPLDQLIALVVFAVVGSYTPGPNTTIATLTGANWGLRSAIPHAVGVPIGFVSMLLAGAAGMAALIVGTPWLAQWVKWLGIAYLVWIGLKFMHVAWAAGERVGVQISGFARPFKVWQSAACQLANPKAWMLVAATSAAYMQGDRMGTRVAVICLVFALATSSACLTWSAVGDALRGWLQHGHRLRYFNLLMGLSLEATALWMAFTA